MERKFMFEVEVDVRIDDLFFCDVDSYVASHMAEFDATDGFGWAEHRAYLRTFYLKQVALRQHLAANADDLAKFIRPAVEMDLLTHIGSGGASMGAAMREIAAAINETEHFFPAHLKDMGDEYAAALATEDLADLISVCVRAPTLRHEP